MAPKKDEKLPFCVGYRRLNLKMTADLYSLPRAEDCANSLGESDVFSTIDCDSGYRQIPVAREDRDKTTFTMFWDTYRYIRVPCELRNAPAIFHRALSIILSGVRWQVCLVYLDDVFVFSKNVDDHVRHLDTLLSLLRDAGTTLKLRKGFFFRPRVEYLGHLISPGKLAVSNTHIDAFRTSNYLILSENFVSSWGPVTYTRGLSWVLLGSRGRSTV